jgi:hypothetical protein
MYTARRVEFVDDVLSDLLHIGGAICSRFRDLDEGTWTVGSLDGYLEQRRVRSVDPAQWFNADRPCPENAEPVVEKPVDDGGKLRRPC